MDTSFGFGKLVELEFDAAIGRVHVGFMDPEAVMGLVDHEQVKPLARDVNARLRRVMDVL